MSVNSNSTVTTPAESVPLPRSSERSSKPPVWPIESTEGSQPAPLASKCARHSRADGICCKDLKDDDERTLVDPDIVRDVVIGFSDGITVPFALAAGLSSLGSSRLVVLGGVAELIAGAISMGVGGFLASQAERDYYRFLRVQTAARVGRSCAGEMEREVSEVLAPIGVDDVTCRAVAKDLRDVEGEGQQHARNDAESNISLRWSKDVGLTAFLLKFGEGLEEIPTRRLYISALTIALGYLLGGLIPLFPYFFVANAQIALVYSCIVTGFVLLVFGAVKSRVTGAGRGISGIFWGAVSTLLVGSLAAGAAFGIVRLLEAGDEGK